MQPKQFNLLGIRFDLLNMKEAVDLITRRIEAKETGYISLVSAHPAIEAQFAKGYKAVLNNAGLVLPDGMSTIWAARLFGNKIDDRIYGPDLMSELLRVAEDKNYSSFFYGGTEEASKELIARLKDRFPRLKIAGTYSPPFRELSEDEDKDAVKYIKDRNPDILWVGLGAPKQDIWMSLHKDRLDGIMQIGVGAAFRFHARLVRQAPEWMQRCGLEWFFRIIQEPKRLWWRYFKCVPLFILFVLLQYIGVLKYDKERQK